MKQRGRKQNLAVATDSAISGQERPEPPNSLTPEQRVEWILVVNALPADWFADYSHQTLVQYCRHVVAARHIAQLIDRLESGDDLDIKEYSTLLDSQIKESRIIASLMTKMRLTQQSTYSDKKGKPAQKKIQSPWES